VRPSERIKAAVRAASEEFCKNAGIGVPKDRPIAMPDFVTIPAWQEAVELELDRLAGEVGK
jgi:hypothetical protein